MLPDHEHDAIDKLKRVTQHQRLHFAVVRTAPVGTLQKRPSDLHLGIRHLEVTESGASNDSARVPIDHRKGALRFDRTVEVPLEVWTLVPVPLGMLLPDEWIAGSLEERVEVVELQWTQLEQAADQVRLEVEGSQASSPVGTRS